ncbi:MAG: type II secretion system F family protein [Vampirovibrionales bacterium]|nr:type II secretion system F family protein [Vampirovibrionales bacterium]
MPIYTYIAIDPSTSKSIEGKLEALNLRAAKEMIRGQGQIPTKLEEDADHGGMGQLMGRIPLLSSLTNPSLRDTTIFTQQLYTLLDAGIPLIEGLFLLEQQTSNKTMQNSLRKIRTDVISGDSFSAAINRYPAIFNKLYVNMIRAGEVSGNLDEICKRLAILLDKEMAIKGKVKGAMVVPVITALIIFAVTLGLLIWVVPQFASFFSSHGGELPLPTQILMMASNFLVAFWWALIIAGVALFFWFNFFRNSKMGKPLVDQWVLTLPVFGDLLNKSYSSSFVRTLATLQASGVSLTEAIGTGAGTIDNTIVRLTLDKARESILVGGTLARPLEQGGVMPFMVVKMIAIGEETGNLEGMLYKASDLLDREVDEAIDNMTKLIQPAMTVVLGAILLFVLLGLYLPIFDMHKMMGK